MPRYLLLLWAPGESEAIDTARGAAAWARWIVPPAREGVVRAGAGFAARMATVAREHGVTTVTERAARDDGQPWGFLLVEAENLASAVAIGASGPDGLAARVEVREIDARGESA